MGVYSKEKDATRAERKAKKRKAENAIPDLPGDVDSEKQTVMSEAKTTKKRSRLLMENDDATTQSSLPSKALTSRDVQGGLVVDGLVLPDRLELRKEKKSKKVKNINGDILVGGLRLRNCVGTVDRTTDVQQLSDSKIEREIERKAVEAGATENGLSKIASPKPVDDAPTGVAGIIKASKPKKNNRNREKKRKGVHSFAEGVGQDSESAGKTPARFIVFIGTLAYPFITLQANMSLGNLPFSATKESIEKHFAAVKPSSVRNLTQRLDPGKSKGCAFVEFDGYDYMKTCLKLYHHSMFDDGISPPRKINVELTAGGGGKTKLRKAKIVGKNEKLNEERMRRMRKEKSGEVITGAVIDHNDVHPSRRARVPVVS